MVMHGTVLSIYQVYGIPVRYVGRITVYLYVASLSAYSVLTVQCTCTGRVSTRRVYLYTVSTCSVDASSVRPFVRPYNCDSLRVGAACTKQEIDDTAGRMEAHIYRILSCTYSIATVHT